MSIRHFAFAQFEQGKSAMNTWRAAQARFGKGSWSYTLRLWREWQANGRCAKAK